MNIVFRIQPPVIWLLAGVLGLSVCSRSDAAINVKNYYRLGENDPGAVSGGIVTNTTEEIAGNMDGIQHGNPHYTNDVSTDAAIHADSSLSVIFNGSSQWFSNAVLIPTPNNFGIEAWVKPATVSGLHVVADDGNGVTTGWAIRQNGNVYQAEFTGVERFGTGAVTLNGWTHLALVRDNGIATLYVNGVPAGTSANTPVTPTGSFTIGAYPPTGSDFDGLIDEVRLFTFSPGQFGTNDLLLKAPLRPPVVVTAPVTLIFTNGATLNATVGPNGLAMTAWFEWGLTTNYGSVAPVLAPGAGNLPLPFQAQLAGLTPATFYHYRAAATNDGGLARGEDGFFRTGGLIAVTNFADGGPGSLRAAISNNLGDDVIYFLINGLITLTNGEFSITRNLTIAGPGANILAISGNLGSRIFNISNDTTVNLSGLTLRDGHTLDGFDNTDIAQRAGEGANGGGIYNAGTLALEGCTLTGNSAGAGGNAPIGFGGVGGFGGALVNVGQVKMLDCTLDHNFAGEGGFGIFGPGPGGSGGAIYNTGTLALTNCTINENFAGNGGSGAMMDVAGGSGGGLQNTSSAILISCTLIGNSAGRGNSNFNGTFGPTGYGGGVCSIAPFWVGNTIVAGNGVLYPGLAPDILGAINSLGHNLIGIADQAAPVITNLGCCDLIGTPGVPVDAALRSLADNGGPTLTQALRITSPALDAGDDSLTNAVPTDQRGYPRKTSAHVDIGALEFQPPTLPLRISNITGLGSIAVRLTFTNSNGGTFTILATTNASLPIANWEDIGPAILTAPGAFQFTDAAPTNHAARFFRLRTP